MKMTTEGHSLNRTKEEEIGLRWASEMQHLKTLVECANRRVRPFDTPCIQGSIAETTIIMLTICMQTMMLEFQMASRFKWPVNGARWGANVVLEGNNTNEGWKPTVCEHATICNNALPRSVRKEGRYCEGE